MQERDARETDESGRTDQQYDRISLALWQDETQDETHPHENDHDGQTSIGATRAPMSQPISKKCLRGSSAT
jgi:hypothetical protein